MQGVTPVPIPNTEVKPLQPMILLSGKVGYRRLYGPRQDLLTGPALFFWLRVLLAGFTRQAIGLPIGRFLDAWLKRRRVSEPPVLRTIGRCWQRRTSIKVLDARWPLRVVVLAIHVGD